MSDSSTITTETAWRDWKKSCAVGRCSDLHAAQLRTFGSYRFSSGLRKCARPGLSLTSTAPANPADAWHMLEVHIYIGKTRKGKQCKDWLFERADQTTGDWITAIESGASLLFLEVVRDYLRRELPPARHVSLHESAGPSGDSALTLEDLLPQPEPPTSDLEEREWRVWATALALRLLDTLDKKSLRILYARSCGASLNDPRLAKALRASTSSIYATHRTTLDLIIAAVRRDLPDDPPAIHTHATARVVEALVEQLQSKKVLENWTSPCVKEV
ncbi:MAG TPA: hypothetical protein PKE55_05475 [Kiritimatiellia bacterium]|nr:hypothetical protein [Kiritimatiellia bacterium]